MLWTSDQPDGRLSTTHKTAGGARCIATTADWSGRQNAAQSITCCMKTSRSPRSTSKMARSDT
eukprot:6308515-Alexandrium_andersonii.AAC.1